MILREYKLEVSEHAEKRLKERSGLNKKSVQKMAERAYEQGIKHSETKGNLRKYISGLTNEHRKKGTDIRVYGDKAFIFVQKQHWYDPSMDYVILVTVLQIPSNLKKLCEQCQVKKQKSCG